MKNTITALTAAHKKYRFEVFQILDDGTRGTHYGACSLAQAFGAVLSYLGNGNRAIVVEYKENENIYKELYGSFSEGCKKSMKDTKFYEKALPFAIRRLKV